MAGERSLSSLIWSRRCIDLAQFGEVPGLDVVRQLEKAGRIHGLPTKVRTDNGKQFVCQEFRALCKKHGLVHTRIRPGHPEENGVVARFKRTLREECLNLFWFEDPRDLQRRMSPSHPRRSSTSRTFSLKRNQSGDLSYDSGSSTVGKSESDR